MMLDGSTTGSTATWDEQAAIPVRGRGRTIRLPMVYPICSMFTQCKRLRLTNERNLHLSISMAMLNT